MKSGNDGKNTQKNYIEETCRRQTASQKKHGPMILQSKIEAALESLGRNKAPRMDGTPIELFQALDNDALKALTRICQRIWTIRQWAADWKRSVHIPIPKKVDNKICDNYPTLALISHASKVMFKLIQKILPSYLERKMSEIQAEFEKGRGIRDYTVNT